MLTVTDRDGPWGKMSVSNRSRTQQTVSHRAYESSHTVTCLDIPPYLAVRTVTKRGMPDNTRFTTHVHDVLRPITFCCVHPVLLRPTGFIIHNRDCRGKFLICSKICPGIHGNHGCPRLPIPFTQVFLRSSRFLHGDERWPGTGLNCPPR